MSAERAVLGFVLDAPLQAWGTASRFQRRGTNAHPSKSGVLGLIAAALGIDKNEAAEASRLQPLAALDLSTVLVPEERPAPVRRLTDYHTVGGGYDDRTARGRLSIPRKASGPPFGTVVSRREYLCGAFFVVLLKGNREELDRIAKALENPVWGIWLGRKSCVPATPAFPVIGTESQAVFSELLKRCERAARPLEEFDRYCEAETEAGASPKDGLDGFPDQPLSFGARRYATRRVRHLRPGQAEG